LKHVEMWCFCFHLFLYSVNISCQIGSLW